MVIFIILILINVSFSISSYSNTLSDKITFEKIAENQTKTANTLFNQAKYSDAVIFFQKASVLYEQTANWANCVENLIESGKCFRNIEQFDNAETYFNKAEKIAKEKLKLNSLIFSSLYSAQSYLYYAKSEYKKSIQLAENSIKIRYKINGGSDTLLYYPIQALGMNYYSLGENNKSLYYYRKSLSYAMHEKNKYNYNLAYSLNRIGLIFWAKGLYDEALEYYNKTLLIQTKLNDKQNDYLAYLYNNIAELYKESGNDKEALFLYDKAINILKINQENNSSLLGTVFFNKAFIYSRQNDFDKVIDNCNKSYVLLSKNISINSRLLSYNYYFLSKAYFEIGNAFKSTESITKCLDITRIYKKENDPYNFFLIAKAYEKLKHIEKADSMFNISLTLFEKNPEKNNNNLANIYLCYGTFCIEHGKIDKSLELYNKTYNIYLKKYGINNSNISVVLNNIGKAWFLKSDYNKSLHYYQLALSSQIKGVKKDDIYDNPTQKKIPQDIEVMVSLKGKAKALYNRYSSGLGSEKDISLSLKTYELAINSIDKLKMLYYNSESSIALTENENNTYDEAVEVAAKLYEITSSDKYFNMAFNFAEKSKSSSLLSIIRNNEALTCGKVPLDLQNFEKELKTQIGYYKQLITEEEKQSNPDENKITYWSDKLMEFKNRNEMFVVFLENKFPDYFNLKYNTNVVSVDSIKNKLRKNEVLVEYVQTKNRLFSFVINKNNHKLYSQIIDSSFYKNIYEYVECINSPEINEYSSCDKFISSASDLYKLLIQPIESLVNTSDLIIIPDEALYNIPFESLLYKSVSSDVKGYARLPYLVKKNAISYNASATILFENNTINNNNSSESTLLAFAPSYNNVNKTDNQSMTAETRSYLKTLKPLYGAAEEVKGISKIVDGEVFSGNNATLNNFKINSKKFDIIHLAMHTIIDDQNPLLSKFAFAPDQNNNGLLSTYEIYNMKINARMTVLSACKTGFGKITKSEGMLCLSRGFLYAGCPSIVMTMWEINDKTGSELMKNFYKYIAEGKSKDEALRLSKIDYINSADNVNASPYYWAGYINYGNNSPLFTPSDKNNNYSYILILIALVITSSMLVFFRNNLYKLVLQFR